MSEPPKFDYGETVQITSKEPNGRIGAVVGINGSESDRTYAVEFGDGREADFGGTIPQTKPYLVTWVLSPHPHHLVWSRCHADTFP